jgi:hypothetical protein
MHLNGSTKHVDDFDVVRRDLVAGYNGNVSQRSPAVEGLLTSLCPLNRDVLYQGSLTGCH